MRTKSISLHYIGTASIQYTIYKLLMSCDNSISLRPNFIKILHNLRIDQRKLSCDFDNFHIKFCWSIVIKLCLLKWTLFQIFQLLWCVCMITVYFLCIYYVVNSNQSLYDYSLGDLKQIVVLMYLLILHVCIFNIGCQYDALW